MKPSRVPLRPLFGVAAVSFPLVASATGAEMGPLGGALLLMGIGAVALLQLVTLVIYTSLPGKWPRLARTLLAVALPLVMVGFIWLGLAAA